MERFRASPWYVRFTIAAVIGVATALVMGLIGIKASGATPVPGAGPSMCRPEPSEYPGCTRQQVIPYEQAEFVDTFTGHQQYYRYWEMGQKPSGHLLDTISPALDQHLANLWWDAYYRAKARSAKAGVEFNPAFDSWRAFSNAASAGCPGALMSVALPFAWCSAHAAGFEDADWRSALWNVTKAQFGCAAGAGIVWRMMSAPNEDTIVMAAGRLREGFWEAVVGQTACLAVWTYNQLHDFLGKK